MFLLWCAGLGAAAQFAKFSITLGDVAQRYPGAQIDVSLVLSIIGVVGIFFGAVAGVMVERAGFRKVLIFALILGAILSTLQAAIPPLSIMLGSRVLEGVSHLGIVIAAPTLMALLSAPRHRPIVMGIWASFFGISYALTGWLGVPLLQTWGLRAVFLAHAVFMAELAVRMVIFLPAGVGMDSNDQTKKPRLTWKSWFGVHRETYSQLRVSLPGISFLWLTLMFIALLTFLPNFAEPDQRPLLIVIMPLASIVGTLAAGFVAQRVSPAVPGAIGFATVVVLITVMWTFLDVYPQFYGGLAIAMMMGSGAVQGAVFALVPALNFDAASQARANGAVAQLGNLGTAIGTPLFALALGVAGFAGLAGTTIVLSLAGVATLLFVILGQVGRR